MPKEFWINLPVKDVKKSTTFFSKLGFAFNTQHSNEHSACMLMGEKNVVVMLFEAAMFQQFTQNALSDAHTATQVLLSLDAQSRTEVDELAAAAVAAGGILFGKPAEIQGWMYGCGFADLDGHRWNILFMDSSKL